MVAGEAIKAAFVAVKPFLPLLVLAAALSSIYGAYQYGKLMGYGKAHNEYEAIVQKIESDYAAREKELELRAAYFERQYELEQAAVKTEFVEIEREVVRYVDRYVEVEGSCDEAGVAQCNCRLNDDGLRHIWNAANRGRAFRAESAPESGRAGEAASISEIW